jgi:nucleoside-diphosphate-sugar epimerase
MAIGQGSMENLVKKTEHTALITGAGGFIGSHLCAALIAKNWHVTALDLPSADWWRHNALAIRPPRIEINMADSEALKNASHNNSFECVFHLAAMTDVTRDATLLDTLINENIITTNNLLRIFRTRASRIVIAGTCEEYGNGPVPFSETQREIAVSPYSWSKICTTHLAELYARIFDTPVMVVRPFLTYGPLQTSTMLIPAAIRAALRGEALAMTKGEQTRDFNFVSDIVDGLVRMAEVSHCDEQMLNLGSGVETTISFVVQLIYELCDARIQPRIGALPYRPGENMRFFSDNQRAKRILGWTSRVSLREGLIRTIAWYRQHLQQEKLS